VNVKISWATELADNRFQLLQGFKFSNYLSDLLLKFSTFSILITFSSHMVVNNILVRPVPGKNRVFAS
jgi:hypothetical protein